MRPPPAPEPQLDTEEAEAEMKKMQTATADTTLDPSASAMIHPSALDTINPSPLAVIDFKVSTLPVPEITKMVKFVCGFEPDLSGKPNKREMLATMFGEGLIQMRDRSLLMRD